MKNVILFISMLAVFMLLYSCDENSSKPDPKDPCEGVLPVKADFEMYERAYWGEKHFLQKDTVNQYNVVTFKALGNYDNYEWQLLGDDRIYNEKNVVFRFTEPWDLLNIRLIVSNNDSTGCFENEKLKDTLMKSFTVQERFKSNLYGTYYGEQTSEPGEKFEVKIYYSKGEFDDRHWEGVILLDNLNKGCFNKKISGDLPGPSVQLHNGYNFGLIRSSYPNYNNCLRPEGYVWLSKDLDTLYVDYEWGYPDENRIKDFFVGVRQK